MPLWHMRARWLQMQVLPVRFARGHVFLVESVYGIMVGSLMWHLWLELVMPGHVSLNPSFGLDRGH